MEEHLDARGLVIFHALPRTGEYASTVHWDTENHPDYRTFVAAGEAAGVRLVTLYARQFSEEMLEDAVGRLEDARLPRDEQRGMESRLQELRRYVGFTCQIELSFDVAPRVYLFDLRTDWFEELNEILDQIDDAYEPDEDDTSGPFGDGGYYSKN